MKTALQHFNELPEPLGQICIEEAERQYKDLNEKFNTTSEALENVLSWWASELGWEFYIKLFYDILYHESQPIELSYSEANIEVYSILERDTKYHSFEQTFNKLFKITRR